MPISLQQYRVGIIYTHKAPKYTVYDTTPHVNVIKTVNKLKIPMIIKLTLFLSLLYFLSEYNQNHHEGKNDSYNQVEYYKNKYLHFKSKQRVPTKILQQNIYYFSFAKTK